MIGETRVNPDALTGRHKMRKDKAERMESVLEGRQDRSYGAAAGRRKQKSGECLQPLIAASKPVWPSQHLLSEKGHTDDSMYKLWHVSKTGSWRLSQPSMLPAFQCQYRATRPHILQALETVCTNSALASCSSGEM